MNCGSSSESWFGRSRLARDITSGVIAACPACDPVATPGVSETAMFYEDPLGVATGRVGFPDPP